MDRVVITVGVGIAGLPPDTVGAVDGTPSAFALAVVQVVCSTRAAVLPVAASGTCASSTKVVVNSILSTTGNRGATDITFYMLYDGAVVPGDNITKAFSAYTPQELEGIFTFPLLAYQTLEAAPNTSAAPNTDDGSSDTDNLVFVVVVLVVALGLASLMLAVVYATLRIRALRSMLTVCACVLLEHRQHIECTRDRIPDCASSVRICLFVLRS